MGFICKVIVLSLSICLISVGPEVITTSAIDDIGSIFPLGVTTGIFSIPCVSLIAFSFPLNVKSILLESTVISAILKPELNASTLNARDCAVILLSANLTLFGLTCISGAPSTKPGIGRI